MGAIEATEAYSLSIGVELELWVVDEKGRLCDGTDITEAHQQIEPEFIDPLIEVKTEPQTSERGLRRDLQSTLQTGIKAAERAGKRLVPFGTPLTASNPPANCERGRIFETISRNGSLGNDRHHRPRVRPLAVAGLPYLGQNANGSTSPATDADSGVQVTVQCRVATREYRVVCVGRSTTPSLITATVGSARRDWADKRF